MNKKGISIDGMELSRVIVLYASAILFPTLAVLLWTDEFGSPSEFPCFFSPLVKATIIAVICGWGFYRMSFVLLVKKKDNRLVMCNLLGKEKASVDLEKEIFWQEIDLITVGRNSSLSKKWILMSNEPFKPYPKFQWEKHHVEFLEKDFLLAVRIFGEGKYIVVLKELMDQEDISSWIEIHSVDLSQRPPRAPQVIDYGPTVKNAHPGG